MPIYIAIIISTFLAASAAAQNSPFARSQDAPPPRAALQKETDRAQPLPRSGSAVISSAVIAPVRSANVPAEVSGVIENVRFDKGEFIQKDQIVVDISKKKYAVLVRMAEEKMKGLDLHLKQSEQSLNMKKEIYSKHYGTKQKLLEAEAEYATVKLRLEEAARELELARMNLAACAVKAPFSGYLAERFKEPHEAVNQLERLFSLVDTHRVYAAANVSETQLPLFEKGAPASFTDASGRGFKGKVDKVEAVLCPESRTAKVLLLIENPKGELKVGMTGKMVKE
jgi:RND family efflux transporter MFP subunit